MNYTEIQTTAFGYADRTDTETLNRYDDFLRIVEAKINRIVKTLKMAVRSTTLTSLASNYYGLPSDFLGMRDLRINGVTANGGTETITALYRTPAQINEVKNTPTVNNEIFYSIIANQIHLQPPQDSKTMEMVYYKKVPDLTSVANTNWMSEENPDCYVFGVLAEINAFNKDVEAATLWSGRFNEALDSIENNDEDIRWGSGDSLTIRNL